MKTGTTLIVIEW